MLLALNGLQAWAANAAMKAIPLLRPRAPTDDHPLR